MKYQSEIFGAYQDIRTAGAEILVKKPAASFNPISEKSIYPFALLSEAVTDTDTEFVLSSTSSAFSKYGIVQIRQEKLRYTRSGDIYTVIRGYDNTTAADYLAGVSVKLLTNLFPTYALLKNYNINLIDGSMVKKGDKMMLIPSFNFTFQIDTTCIINQSGKNFKIINIEEISPGGECILYKIQVRE